MNPIVRTNVKFERTKTANLHLKAAEQALFKNGHSTALASYYSIIPYFFPFCNTISTFSAHCTQLSVEEHQLLCEK